MICHSVASAPLGNSVSYTKKVALIDSYRGHEDRIYVHAHFEDRDVFGVCYERVVPRRLRRFEDFVLLSS